MPADGYEFPLGSKAPEAALESVTPAWIENFNRDKLSLDVAPHETLGSAAIASSGNPEQRRSRDPIAAPPEQTSDFPQSSNRLQTDERERQPSEPANALAITRALEVSLIRELDGTLGLAA